MRAVVVAVAAKTDSGSLSCEELRCPLGEDLLARRHDRLASRTPQERPEVVADIPRPLCCMTELPDLGSLLMT